MDERRDGAGGDRPGGTGARRRAAPLLAGCLLAAACGEAAPAAAGEVGYTRAAEAIAWRGSFALEEPGGVVTVEPVVAADPRGGFLVADVSEAQVRRYAPSGRLLWRAGRKGGGPGEFTAPTAVARLRSGEILVANRMERLTVFDSAGARVVRTVRTPLGHIEDLAVVDDSLALIAAVRRGELEGPRLHLWDLRRDRVAASFFAPLGASPNRAAAGAAGWTKLSLRGDTVAAIFATSDTAYLFTTRGKPLGRMPIPFARFRRGTRRFPRNPSDAREQAEFLSTIDFVADIHWLPDGRLLVPYQDIVPERALARRWHLLEMTRAGERVWEVRGVPRLLEVDANDGSLYFLDPNAEVASQWAIARTLR